tara:strand:- start:4153 stop:4497 length:345 start_codon:yes stop_codon:yes gene_type:complete
MCSSLDTWALFFVAGDMPLRQFIMAFVIEYLPIWCISFGCIYFLERFLEWVYGGLPWFLKKRLVKSVKGCLDYFLHISFLVCEAGGYVILPLTALAMVVVLFEILIIPILCSFV